MKPRVAYVRGADLNPWQMHAFADIQREFDLVAVGSRTHHFELPSSGLKTVLRPGLGGLRLPGFMRFLRRWFARDKIIGLERSLAGCRLVHTVDLAAGYSLQALRYCQQSGARLVCTVFENIPWVHEEIPRLRRQKDELRAGVDRFLCVTRRAAEVLALEGVPRERLEVIGPGVDLTHFHPQAPPRALGLPAEEFRVLYAGRLVPEKGLRCLVAAVAWVHQHHPGVRLILAGSGPEQAALNEHARRFGIADRVHSPGYVPYAEVPGLFTAAHCLALPSLVLDTWHEQYGMVLAEAMAAGLPVVGSDCGSIPEVVGPAGTLVTTGDPIALGEALLQLARSPQLQRERGLASRRWAEETMDCRESARRLARVYRSLLSE